MSTLRLATVEAQGVMMTPRTPMPAMRRMTSSSRSAWASEEQSMGTQPPSRRRSSIPRAASV
nr:hypothetical protein [Actinomyces slackii]